MNYFLKFSRCTLIMLLFTASLGKAADLSELARLKIAAEAGDMVAQFEYAQGGTFSNATERAAWLRKSAEQGYAPAQDAVADYFANLNMSGKKKKNAADREAARWASRAAYRGLASAQLRMGRFYDRGVGVLKDPVNAYMWMQISVQTAARDADPTLASTYKIERDHLTTHTSTENIAEGQRRAAAFTPSNYDQMNLVEADLIFVELKLNGISELKDSSNAVLNNVSFSAGETKTVKLDEQSVALTCLAIENKSARFAIAGTNYQTTFQLKR